MPDVETRLGLRAASLADVADAFVAIDNFRDDAQVYLERLLDLRMDGPNGEGVVGSTDGACTRINANTVRVAAGSAWIEADGVTLAGINGAAGYARTGGLYKVSWPQTDLTVASTGTNKRLDRVVVPVGLHGASVAPVLVAGATAATVDHDAQQSAGALPAGRLQLATVIAATTGVSTTNDASNGIRDRRPNCRGFLNLYQASQLGTDYTNATATPTTVMGGMRCEVHGDRPLRVRFQPVVSLSALGVVAFALFTDLTTPGTMAQLGASMKQESMTAGYAATPSYEFYAVPSSARSVYVDVRAWVVSGGGTMTVQRVSPNFGVLLEAWEENSALIDNGAV